MIKRKHRLFFDFTKEELWLSQMSENGYALITTSYTGKYTFQKIEPKKHTYRIDYRIFTSANDFKDYCSMFEDSG